MISATELANELRKARHYEGEEKLQAYKKIWRCVYAIEKAACSDMSIALHEIQHAREILSEVNTGIKRLEQARKKKESLNSARPS